MEKRTGKLISDMFADRQFMGRILAIALPIMLQQVITTGMYMVDTVMIGGLGDTPLAGVGAANQLAYLLDILLFGVASGGGVYMAQFFGKRDRAGFRSTLGLSLILSMAFCAVFVLIAVFFGEYAVGLFTKDQAVREAGTEYLGIACFGYMAKGVIYPFGTAHKSSNNAKLPMISGAAALVVNIFLNWCLIYGNLGFPAMGLRGAAVATLIGSACDAFVMVLASYIKKGEASARAAELFKQQRKFFADFVRISFPAFLDDALWAAGTLGITWIYGRMGTDAFAAMMIVNTVDKLLLIAMAGVGTAAGVVTGNVLGSGDRDKAYLFGRRFMWLSVMIGVISAVMCCAFGPMLPQLYSNTSESVKELAARTIFFMGLTSPTYAINFTIIVGVLRCGGDTRAAAWIDLLPLFLIALPVTALCGLYFSLPLDIVFLCTIPSNFLRLWLGMARVKSGVWARQLV